MLIRNISFAGAGRVAAALARGFADAGYSVDLIVSPSPGNGRALAAAAGARWSAKPEYPESTDLVIVAVPDHALKDVLGSIRCRESALVAHTAGSAGMEVFPVHLKKRGVFYPLQTFSQGRTVDFSGLPFLTEASGDDELRTLGNLARSLGAEVFPVDAGKRAVLHLAAVFICNFTNHMLTAGKAVAGREDIPFSLFKPLLLETIGKALEMGPENSQTGPAVRNDINTIEKHLDLLSFDLDYRDVYKEVTKSLINHYRNKKQDG